MRGGAVRAPFLKKSTEVVITRSKWVLTLMIDLKPYHDLLERLASEIEKVRVIGEEIATDHYSDRYRGIMYSLRQEIQALEDQWKGMGNYLGELKLLQPRKRRAVLPIVSKALNVLFGTVSETELRAIKQKLIAVEEGERVLVQEAKSSLSILNVTRVDLTKNRQAINRLIKGVLDVEEELGNVTRSMSMELRRLRGFVKRFLQLSMAISRLQQTSQSLHLSLVHVRAQLDMLFLGHLSPSLVGPTHLQNILLKIQTELPHHLRLPSDPTRELWRYYSSLGCITLVEEKKILALVPVPLLDRDSTFEVFQVINLPIPYPDPKQELGVVAKYKLEAECIALNLARTQFMLLTKREAEKCKTDALGSCTSKSPMYATGGHRLCLVELFRNNKEGIQQTCHVEVSRRAMMPQAIGLSDGVWAVVLERELALSQVCRGRSTVTIRAAPPLTVISLSMGCSAFGGSITLPPYYQAEEEFETRDSFLALSNVSSSRWAGLWEPLAEKLPVLNKAKLPQLLENIDNINLHKLVYKLETVGRENPAWYDQPAGTIAWGVYYSRNYSCSGIDNPGKAVVDKM